MHHWFGTATIASVILIGTTARQASAVLLYSSSIRNTFAPGSLLGHRTSGDPHGTGDPRRLLNSGWQWQGLFGNFVGTPIDSQFFVTAKHAGATGPTINVNGTAYPIDFTFNGQGWIDDPNTDLRIWKIQNTFASFAPLYKPADGPETGKPIVLFGRGTQRGAEVRENGVLKGWQWGPLDGALSWGENVIDGTVNAGAGFGQWLFYNFDQDGVANEGTGSNRDSSGGVFIKSGGVWKLAGVNIAVTGPWRLEPGDNPFDASIFDFSGLYVGGTPQAATAPSSTYATMISTNIGWIESVIGPTAVPEPAAGMLLLVMPLVARRRARR